MTFESELDVLIETIRIMPDLVEVAMVREKPLARSQIRGSWHRPRRSMTPSLPISFSSSIRTALAPALPLPPRHAAICLDRLLRYSVGGANRVLLFRTDPADFGGATKSAAL